MGGVGWGKGSVGMLRARPRVRAARPQHTERAFMRCEVSWGSGPAPAARPEGHQTVMSVRPLLSGWGGMIQPLKRHKPLPFHSNGIQAKQECESKKQGLFMGDWLGVTFPASLSLAVRIQNILIPLGMPDYLPFLTMQSVPHSSQSDKAEQDVLRGSVTLP